MTNIRTVPEEKKRSKLEVTVSEVVVEQALEAFYVSSTAALDIINHYDSLFPEARVNFLAEVFVRTRWVEMSYEAGVMQEQDYQDYKFDLKNLIDGLKQIEKGEYEERY